MILDGATIGRQTFTSPVNDPREYLLAFYPEAPIPPLTHVVATATPMVARVNHGVWKASCECGAKGLPTPGLVVFVDQPWGWCVRCGNQGSGHGWRRVIVPPPEERRRIVAVLLCRPRVEDRNWEPGETVADLIAENLAHGDPIPPDDEPPAAAPSLILSGPRWPTEAGRALLRAARKRWWQARR